MNSEFEVNLNNMVDKFNQKIKKNKELEKEVENLSKKIVVKTEKQNYFTTLEKGSMEPFKVGTLDNPDIFITAEESTFLALFAKEMGPMKALLTKKLQINASLEDIILIKKLL
jgi:putative sterol carrier protein